jgi:hypothetical protein
MIQNVLTHIGGVGVYGVLSVILFFLVFLGVLVWAFGLRKPYLEAMSRLPLEPETDLPIHSEKETQHD